VESSTEFGEESLMKFVLLISALLSAFFLSILEAKQNFNIYAFAAIKIDGSVVTWGSQFFGGDSSAVKAYLQNSVTDIYSTLTVINMSL
jgi:hypothetical protein